MDRIIAACLERSRAIMMLFLLILVAGTQAYIEIPKEREPSVQIPIIYISMAHQGISPEDAERLLVRPMEKELRAVEGVKELTAHAVEGHASVTLEFTAGFDSKVALDDVREKVDIAKAELPEDTEEPTINEVNLSLFPVLNVILSGDLPEQTLLKSARHLRDKIEEINNVLEVKIGGDREELVEIIIEPSVLAGYGLTVESLASISNGFNRLVAAGALQEDHGRYTAKVPGLIETVEDLMALPVKTQGDRVVSVSDIATIRKTFRDPEGYARVNGQKAMVLEVSKRTGTNIIETIAAVRDVVANERQFLPSNMVVGFSQDGSERILDMLNDLENNIILAVLLVLIVVVYYVGLRSGILVTLAIPGAFLFGVLVLYKMGLTLNIVVLFSLILSVGMLVDAAIIVCEMADRRIAEGARPKVAYLDASQYMKWPIIASTVTTLVAFMPLIAWPGIVGKFMQYLPITLIVVLSGSLLMALIFIPTIGGMWGKAKTLSAQSLDALQHLETGDMRTLRGFYAGYYRWLSFVLKHAGKYVAIMMLILVGSYAAYIEHGAGVEFFPNVEPDNAMVQVRARGNLSPIEKDHLVKEVEAAIKDLQGEVRVFYARTGQTKGGGQQQAEDVIGVINMELSHWRTRRKAAEILSEIKQKTAHIDGIIITTQTEKGGPKSDKAIEIEVGSYFPDAIAPAIATIRSAMQEIEGFIDIEDSRPVPALEWAFSVNRERAAQFSTDTSTVGSFITLVTRGLKFADYRPDDSDDEVDIVVRFPEDKRTVDMFDNLMINTVKGPVPMSGFVERNAAQTIQTISRSDGMRVMNVRADVAEGKIAANLLKELQESLKEDIVDPRLRVRFKGDDEQQKEAGSFLANAFLLALFVMALVLVIQFNSVYYMIIVMSAIVLSTVGVLLGLLATAQPFGIVMCGVGVIALSGIVVNNNIVFIDTYIKLRQTGMDVNEALLRTGVQRVRPILLTAGTTVLGLLPMVASMSINFAERDIMFGAPSSQWWEQLSTTIAGGLTFATILTLFLTPCLLKVGERLGLGRQN